jgi:hypothetical protein
MPHELTHEQNRVAIVNAVITKICNPCKYWTVTIQPFRETQNHSVPMLFSVSLLFDFCLSVFFCSIQCFCWILQCSIMQCIFYSDTGIVFQVFRSHITTTIRHSINIIHQTAPSLSWYRRERPITIIDIEGYPEPTSPYVYSRRGGQ